MKKPVGVNGIDPARQRPPRPSQIKPNIIPPKNDRTSVESIVFGHWGNWGIDRLWGMGDRSVVGGISGEPGECHSPLRDFSSSIATYADHNSLIHRKSAK